MMTTPNDIAANSNLPLFVKIQSSSQYLDALIWTLENHVWDQTKEDVFVLNPDGLVKFDLLVAGLKADGHKWAKEDVLTKPRESKGQKGDKNENVIPV